MAGSPPKSLHTMVPGGPASRKCSRSRSRSKVTWYRHFCDFTKKTILLLLPGKWLERDQTHSFANLLFPFSVPFSSAPSPQMAVSLCCEFCRSSHLKAVCQTICYTVQYHVLSLRAHNRVCGSLVVCEGREC